MKQQKLFPFVKMEEKRDGVTFTLKLMGELHSLLLAGLTVFHQLNKVSE